MNPINDRSILRFAWAVIGWLMTVQVLTASSAASAELKHENRFDVDWRFLLADGPGAGVAITEKADVVVRSKGGGAENCWTLGDLFVIVICRCRASCREHDMVFLFLSLAQNP